MRLLNASSTYAPTVNSESTVSVKNCRKPTIFSLSNGVSPYFYALNARREYKWHSVTGFRWKVSEELIVDASYHFGCLRFSRSCFCQSPTEKRIDEFKSKSGKKMKLLEQENFEINEESCHFFRAEISVRN